MNFPVWAGVLPLDLIPSTPIPDAALAADISVPSNISSYSRKLRR
jgi:hypothetical protein